MKNFDKKSIAVLITDFVAVAGAILARIFIPLLTDVLPDCPFAANGIQCGSCGGTRCVYNFFKGNFIKAFEYNQYFFFVIIFVLILLVVLNLSWLFKMKRTDKLLRVLTDYRTIIVIGVLYAVFTVARIFILNR